MPHTPWVTRQKTVLALALLLALTMGACGLKGDLYIPPEPKAPAAPVAPPSTDTVVEPSTPEPAAEKAPVEEEVTDE